MVTFSDLAPAADSFSANSTSIKIQKEADNTLVVSAWGQTFKLRHLKGDSPTHLKDKLPEIQLFCENLFKQKFLQPESKIKKIKFVLKNSGELSIRFDQKKGPSGTYKTQEVVCQNEMIKKLFKMNSSQTILEFKRISKGSLSRKISRELKYILSKIRTDIKEKIYNQLHTLTEDERYLAKYLKKKIHLDPLNEPELFTKIVQGAYVMIDDGGKAYEDWVQNFKTKQARFSSHESNAVQYAIRGSFVKEFLFSKKTITLSDGTTKEVTWFQLERYPAQMGYHTRHLWTWALYKMSGQNQGPYGQSPHRERFNPLWLHPNA